MNGNTTHPKITVIAPTPAIEGSDAVFKAVLSKVTGEDVTVSYATSTESGDTAVLDAGAPGGADYTPTTGTVTVPAWHTEATFTVPTTGDTVDEDDETFTVTLSNPSGGTLGSPSTATGTIADNDDRQTLALTNPPPVLESAGSIEIPVSIQPSGKTVSIYFTTWANTEVTAEDITIIRERLTFAPGETSKTFSIELHDDQIAEGDEFFDVTLTQQRNIDLAPGTDEIVVTITDDEPIPRVTLTLDPDSIRESDDPNAPGEQNVSTVTATLSNVSSQRTEIFVRTSAPRRFTELSENDWLRIPAGQTESVGTVTIKAVNDNIHDADKTQVVGASATNAAGVTRPADVELTVREDDTESTSVTLSLNKTEVVEGAVGGAQEIEVTAELDAAGVREDTTVTVSVGAGAGIAGATEGADFTAVNDFTVVIGAGNTIAHRTFALATVDDNIDEPVETVTVTGSVTASGLAVLPAAGLTVGIVDNDATPVATLVLTPASIPENGATSTVTARLNRASSEETRITVSASPVGPAVSGDFALSVNKVLTIAAGETESDGVVTIDSVDNVIDDADDKRVTVSAQAANDLDVTPPNDVTLTITDDESASMAVTLTVSTANVSEGVGSSGRTVTVTATLDGAASPDATAVTVSVASGTAISGTDFTAVSNFTITIPGGDTNASEPFTLRPIDDTVDEPNETLNVTGTASGLTVQPATLTIADDDDAPKVDLVLDPASISELGGVATVTARLDHASSQVTTVRVSATAVLPAVAGDFGQNGMNLTIPAGATASNGRVTIEANDNIVYETGKTVTVSATADNDLGIDQPESETLTITEDEAASASATLTVSPERVPEGATGSARTVTVTATLNAAARPDATNLTVSVGSGAGASGAVSGTDFSTVNDFTLTIPAKASSGAQEFTLAPVDDDIDEPDEDGADHRHDGLRPDAGAGGRSDRDDRG